MSLKMQTIAKTNKREDDCDLIKEIFEYLDAITSNPTVMLFGAITLIEFTPIKINPWGWIFSHIGNALNKNVRKDIGELQRSVEIIENKQVELKHKLEEDQAQNKRRHILEFANSCRRGQEHDQEEWNNVITDIKDYENIIKEQGLSNGVIEENIKYLRELYHDRNVKNDFL